MRRNEDIRQTAKERGVFLWEIAEAMGIQDGTFSRKLRRELQSKEKVKVREIISQLAKEREAT